MARGRTCGEANETEELEHAWYYFFAARSLAAGRVAVQVCVSTPCRGRARVRVRRPVERVARTLGPQQQLPLAADEACDKCTVSNEVTRASITRARVRRWQVSLSCERGQHPPCPCPGWQFWSEIMAPSTRTSSTAAPPYPSDARHERHGTRRRCRHIGMVQGAAGAPGGGCSRPPTRPRTVARRAGTRCAAASGSRR